jgi:hypothetical protein
MKDEGFCYVAADPDQPGAAWAAAADDPKDAKYTAKNVADWIKEGAHVMRVPTQTAREMLAKWVRPEKKRRGEQDGQGTLI